MPKPRAHQSSASAMGCCLQAQAGRRAASMLPCSAAAAPVSQKGAQGRAAAVRRGRGEGPWHSLCSPRAEAMEGQRRREEGGKGGRSTGGSGLSGALAARAAGRAAAGSIASNSLLLSTRSQMRPIKFLSACMKYYSLEGALLANQVGGFSPPAGFAGRPIFSSPR